MEEKCPESRCTFTTDRSLDNQEQADAVLFHMPNFHWDRSQITGTRLYCVFLIYFSIVIKVKAVRCHVPHPMFEPEWIYP